MEELKKIWMDGKFVDWRNATIHILTHSLHYGGGVFEGIRAYDAKNGIAVFRLQDHIKRLFYSASCLEIEIPFSEEEIENAVLETIKVNDLKECYIRPIVFLGYGKMGLNPKGSPVNVAIAAWPWEAYLGGKETISAKISKFIRIHPASTVADAKICGHYSNSILASIEAKNAGCEEAIFLDFEGNIAEGPGENIFIVKNGRIFTPSTGSILPGITRDTVFKIISDLGLSAEEKKITPDEIKKADEAFFTGTAVEICPVGKIDDAEINSGKAGEITKKIKDSFLRIIHGEEEKYLNWLTFVK